MKLFLLVLMLLSSAARALDADTATAPAVVAESIWPRLAAGMRLGGEERPEVQRFIRHYRSNPAYFTAMLARSEPFLWFVLRAVEARQQPTELALLPAVESSWNPHAISVSSAYGLWQFIPRTGQDYGLRDALNYDARRDPVASTRVALGLLDELHREYGSWPLSLAAYNTGGVRLKQAMRKARSRDFWRLPLPPVTRDYVPRLLAIAALVRNPSRHGLTLPPIAAHDVAEVIDLDHGDPLHQALHAAAVDLTVLRTYNPALHAIDAPTQSPTLLLPPADAVALRAELASLREASAASSLPRPLPAAAVARYPKLTLQMQWQMNISDKPRAAAVQSLRGEYLVQEGDTFFGIAQRHGTTVAALRKLNPALHRSALKPGQTIRLNACSLTPCG